MVEEWTGWMRMGRAVFAMVALAAGLTAGRAQNSAAAAAAEIGRAAVRVIVDEGTGDRWLLERDAGHPGGPGRMVRLEGGAGENAEKSGPPAKPPAMVIHAGDRVTLEEKTAVAEAHLEAVALRSAPGGGALTVRIEIGGQTVPAVAVAPGRVRLAGERER